MQNVVAAPRKLFGLIVIALLLGPASLMLWLGRWRAALAYVLASLGAIGLFFAFSSHPPAAKLGLSDAFSIIALALSLIGLVHAIRIRKSALRRPWYSRWYVALTFPLVATFALLVGMFGIRTFLYQPFNMPSASMYPTLKVGDYFFVSKLSYGCSKYSFNFSVVSDGVTLINCCHFDFPGRVFFAASPERGDVAVFKLPTNTEIDYIKRVIGLPGDHVQMKDGVLYINGEAVPKVRVEDYVDTEPSGGGHPIQQYEETLPNGLKYRVLDEQANGSGDNTMEYVVPADHYFIMGDNRDNSEDSRYLDQVGYVPEENFIGSVAFRFRTNKGFEFERWPPKILPPN